MEFNLININKNFHKLLTNCESGAYYTPLLFNCSENIEALIVLNQIIDIIYKTNVDTNISNIIINQSLERIIIIKCEEFLNSNDFLDIYWDCNINNFILSFIEYINYILMLS